MNAIRYRLAQAPDAQQLADLRWGLRTDDDPVCDADAKARFVQDFAAWMAARPDRDLVHWVAELEGKLIGVISVRIIHKLPSPEDMDGRFGYLTNSYVSPRHRNRSVGTGLLAAVKDWAAGEGLELLVVWPSARAYPFYERGGYRRHPDPVVLKLWED
jgi:GNAT superfamily N-acetyltransferase